MATPYMIEIFNMTLPPEGPGVIPIVHDFTVNETLEIDLTQLINNGVVSYISGVQIDTLEATPDIGGVILESNSSGQRLKVTPGGISFFPTFTPNPPIFVATAIDGFSGIVRFSFVNFPIWPFGDNGAGGGGSAVVGPIIGPAMVTDSLLLDGTSQEIVAAGDAASYFIVQNPIAAANEILVNLGGGDATALGQTVAPGGSLELINGLSGAITISGDIGNTVIFTRGA